MLLLYIVLIPLSLFLLVSLLTRRYRNRWKLYMIFGKKGSGKSSFLVKTAVKYLRKGYIVYSNMSEICVDGVRLIDIDDLGEFVPVSNSVLLVDEVGMIWDNRNFKNFRPSVRDFFKLQRHYKVLVYLASQTYDIDKKLRDLTDAMYLHVSLFGVLSVGKRIFKSITLTESTSEAESRIAENLKFAPLWNWSFTWIPRYKKYFDSFSFPALEKIPYSVVSGLSPYKRNKKSSA